MDNTEKIILACGCFWGVEAYFQRLNGVENTEVGYIDGNTSNPTYKEVCYEDTNHAEAVYIEYDKSIISLDKILEEYFKIIDPTSLNKQGNDRGTQYRTGVYYYTNEDKDKINKFIEEKKKDYSNPIVVEVKNVDESRKFWSAEEYHQDYLDKNPGGYCHINLDSIDIKDRKIK